MPKKIQPIAADTALVAEMRGQQPGQGSRAFVGRVWTRTTAEVEEGVQQVAVDMTVRNRRTCDRADAVRYLLELGIAEYARRFPQALPK